MKSEQYLAAENYATGLRELAEEMEREAVDLGLTHVENLRFRTRTALLRNSAQMLMTQRNQLVEVKK